MFNQSVIQKSLPLWQRDVPRPPALLCASIPGVSGRAEQRGWQRRSSSPCCPPALTARAQREQDPGKSSSQSNDSVLEMQHPTCVKPLLACRICSFQKGACRLAQHGWALASRRAG